MSGVFFGTCCHTFFATLGDVSQWGRQIGVRQTLIAIANVLSLVVGCTTLARFGPWVAFGASSPIEVTAALPC